MHLLMREGRSWVNFDLTKIALRNTGKWYLRVTTIHLNSEISLVMKLFIWTVELSLVIKGFDGQDLVKWFDQLQGTSIYITCTIMWTMVNKRHPSTRPIIKYTYQMFINEVSNSLYYHMYIYIYKKTKYG